MIIAFYLKQCNSEEKLMKKCCDTCELNNMIVCMGSTKRTDNGENTYGMPIEEAKEMFPEGCIEWELSYRSFEEDYE